MECFLFYVFLWTPTRLLELAPRAAIFFGDTDHQDDNTGKPKSNRIKHFETIVHLLDNILQLLGPDFETIGEILEELGRRHKRMGVSAVPVLQGGKKKLSDQMNVFTDR